MADLTYDRIVDDALRVRAGRDAYELVSGWDGFRGGLVGLLGGYLVKWQDTAGVLLLGILLDYEFGDHVADPDKPHGRVNENGDTLDGVAIAGLADETSIGSKVYCGTDNVYEDATLTPTTNAKAIGIVGAFKSANVGSIKLFNPFEYSLQA